MCCSFTPNLVMKNGEGGSERRKNWSVIKCVWLSERQWKACWAITQKNNSRHFSFCLFAGTVWTSEETRGGSSIGIASLASLGRSGTRHRLCTARWYGRRSSPLLITQHRCSNAIHTKRVSGESLKNHVDGGIFVSVLTLNHFLRKKTFCNAECNSTTEKAIELAINLKKYIKMNIFLLSWKSWTVAFIRK